MFVFPKFQAPNIYMIIPRHKSQQVPPWENVFAQFIVTAAAYTLLQLNQKKVSHVYTLCEKGHKMSISLVLMAISMSPLMQL